MPSTPASDPADLGGRLDDLAGRLTEGFAAVRTEMRAEFGAVRAEFREELGAGRVEFRRELGLARREFGVLAGALRDDMRAIAEGVAANTEAIVALGRSLRAEMDARFEAQAAVLRGIYRELKQDIAELRAGR